MHKVKRFFKVCVVRVLSWQALRLQKKWGFKTVGIVGSVGKTTTKHILAQYLAGAVMVRYQQGNYNDLISVPLVLFDRAMPNIYNPIAWIVIFLKNEYSLLQQPSFDIAVLELGTDGPGQIAKFSSFLHLDTAIVTSLSPEHMESFDTLDAVAAEELSVCSFSDRLVVNIDDVPKQYLTIDNRFYTYGSSAKADVQYVDRADNAELWHENEKISFTPSILGVHVRKAYAAAYLVGKLLNVQPEDGAKLLSAVQPMPGRMQRLQGKNNVLILDDTYNASPESVIAALKALYQLPVKKRIVVLGTMNEMGSYSRTAHEEVARYLQKDKLEEVVLLGEETKKYIEPIANEAGISVRSFSNPYKIGAYLVKKEVQPSVYLFKGSQNGVFLEEAIKPLLASPQDYSLLVRQSDYWLKKKRKQFQI